MQRAISRNQGAFTLIEIAVVLVVIGLIAAGILTGRSMIRSSELQKVATNFLKFRDATKQFHDKYKYFPGDMPRAGAFWDLADNCGGGGDPADPVKATCNGNGDGFVGGPVGDPLEIGAEYEEALYFWQHLTNGNFLEGAYSGHAEGGIEWWQPGENLPVGMDNNAAYTFSYANAGTTPYNIIYPGLGSVTGTTYRSNYGHVIVYGNPRSLGNRRTASGVALSGAEAQSIDQKIDDGRPGLGNVLAIPNSTGGLSFLCVDSIDHTTAVYMISRTDKVCSLVFITGL